jgi:uncharacterized protein (TIGR02145 family)
VSEPGTNGEPGESCTLKNNNDGSATITCGKDTFTIKNGTNGGDGEDCDVVEDGAYLVMKCGEIEKARWAKAMCGSTAYDPNNIGDKFCDTRDGKFYKSVKIGTGATAQTWMAENLNYYIAGGSKCYQNDMDNCNIYGRFYDWEAANNACPSGWHLPSDAEWTVLAIFAGGTGTYGETGTAGTKLKAKPTPPNDWWSGTAASGTDDYGFAGLPAGAIDENGSSGFINLFGIWWSATSHSTVTTEAYRRVLESANDAFTRSTQIKERLYNVRCLKNN